MSWQTYTMALVLLVLITLIQTQSFSDEPPETFNQIYMKDGRVIECEMAWIEGDNVKCKKFVGRTAAATVGFPVSTVDLDKSFWKAKEKQDKNLVSVSSSSTRRGDLQLNGFRVKRVVVVRKETRGVYHEISCNIESFGNACPVTVQFAAVAVDGSAVREETLKSKSSVVPGCSSTICQKVWLVADEDSKIAEWKLIALSASDK